jgi:hypothetical protein
MRDGNYSRPNKWKDHIASYGYGVTVASDNSNSGNMTEIDKYLQGKLNSRGEPLQYSDRINIMYDEQHRHHLHIGVKKQ